MKTRSIGWLLPACFAVGCVHYSASTVPPDSPPSVTDNSAPQPTPTTGDISREDWMVVPGRHGGHEVITRAQYLDERGKHVRPKLPSLTPAPPALMNAGAGFTVSVGQIRSYKTIDEPVKRMRVTGSSIRVYWTTPYFIQRIEHGKFIEHPGADVHVEGVVPGQSQLILDLADGTTRTFDIQVRGPGGPAPGT